MPCPFRREFVAASALALLLSNCSGSPDEQIEQSREMLRSWTRTVDLAVEQRSEHRLPDIYMTQLMTSAEQALRSEQSKIHQADNSNRKDLELLAHQLEAKIREQQTILRQQNQRGR
ncbi:MAG: hypothetical protein ABR514_11065 [Chthoniobacterales bacterium]